MTPEEQPTPEQAEALNEYIEALLEGKKPARPPGVSGEHADALRMSALLASVGSPRAQPSASFVDQLRSKLIAQQPRSWLHARLGRRGLLGGLAGAFAAIAAALAGAQAVRLRAEPVPAGWMPVARAAELPPGSVKRFMAGDIQGHVMNIGGKIWALSAICTDMPCLLDWRPQGQIFQCTCHDGGRFGLDGQQLRPDEYAQRLPPLPKIPVQQRNGTIYVVSGPTA